MTDHLHDFVSVDERFEWRLEAAAFKERYPTGFRSSKSGFIVRCLDMIDALEANPRDEFHTMDELYEYRMLYNALAFNALAERGDMPVCKSWRHSDGELCFGGGWFIVVAELPTGQISNHYKAEHWDLFKVPPTLVPPLYDGHSPADAADRMLRYLRDEGDQ